MSKYDATQLSHFEGLEAVRHRIGMYIGNNGKEGAFHLFYEIFANSMDEYLAGHGKKIIVSVEGKKVTVQDEGRGIPIDIVPSSGLNGIEHCLTKLHGGGKLGNTSGYVKSGGLNGVGASCVNALSEYCRVEVCRDGKIVEMQFSKGKVVKPLTVLRDAKPSDKTGTKVEFILDPEVMECTIIDIEEIKECCHKAAYLNSDLTIIVEDNNKNKIYTYNEPEGVVSYIKKKISRSDSLTKIQHVKWSTDINEYDICFVVTQGASFNESFVNNIICREGGTHVTGFARAFTAAANKFARENKILKQNDNNFTNSEVADGLVAVFNLRCSNPQFKSQTKDALTNTECAGDVFSYMQKYLVDLFKDNPDQAKRIFERALKLRRVREQAKAEKEAINRGKDTSLTYASAGKLKDCRRHGVGSGAEIYLVEGDSAGGSAKSGRDNSYQAILALKGKIPNVEKMDLSSALSNTEIGDIIKSLGCGILEDCNPDKLRYDKVCIFTDADVDGYHIAVLLITFFYKFMKKIISNGNLYLVCSPLYKVSLGKETHYIQTDNDLDNFTKELDKKNRKYEIQRFKGLGEMNPETLWETCLNPSNRTLVRLEVEDISMLDEFMRDIMAKANGSEPLKKLIANKAIVMEKLWTKRKQSEVNALQYLLAAYKTYAEYVITDRAIPAIEDGFKPSIRRILYTMYKVAPSNSKHLKSARIVGEVLGKYHPHGDAAVYGAMVALSQKFKNVLNPVDGSGNWGSISNPDSAAAMRYTECRMNSVYDFIIDKRDMVDGVTEYQPNYDYKEVEPIRLPMKLPVTLINGTSGLAVGWGTDILPFNPIEVIKSIRETIKNPNIKIADILNIMPAPDFPGGGIINGTENIDKLYETGRGAITVRARTKIVEENKRDVIYITEVPYSVYTDNLIVKIDDLVKKHMLPVDQITDLSDLKTPVNIAIRIKKGGDPNYVLNFLFKNSDLEKNLKSNMVFIVDNEPVNLGVLDIIKYHIENRSKTLYKRFLLEAKNSRDRLEILDGLIIAFNNTDDVIHIIRSSKDKLKAKECLIKKYNLTDRQVEAILAMPLGKLCQGEISIAENEKKDIIKRLSFLDKATVSDRNNIIDNIMLEELDALEKTLDIEYGNRRSSIKKRRDNIDISSTIKPMDVAVILTAMGYLKCVERKDSNIKIQSRGGKGSNLVKLAEGDSIVKVINCHSTDKIGFVSDDGRVFTVVAGTLDMSDRGTKINLVIECRTKVIEMFTFKSPANFDLFMVKKNGDIKRLAGSEIDNVLKTGKRIINNDKNNPLVNCVLVNGDEDVLLTSHNGMSLRLSSSCVRRMGTTAGGVKGITLDDNDYIVSCVVIKDNMILGFITTDGFIKKHSPTDFNRYNRGAKGNKCINGDTNIADTFEIFPDDEIISIVTSNGKVITIDMKNINITKKTAKGVKAVDLSDNDEVIQVFK